MAKFFLKSSHDYTFCPDEIIEIVQSAHGVEIEHDANSSQSVLISGTAAFVFGPRFGNDGKIEGCAWAPADFVEGCWEIWGVSSGGGELGQEGVAVGLIDAARDWVAARNV